MAKVNTNNAAYLAFLPTNIILNMALFLTNSSSFHWKLVLALATFLTALAQSAAAVPHSDIQLVRCSFSESGSLGEVGWQHSSPPRANSFVFMLRHPFLFPPIFYSRRDAEI